MRVSVQASKVQRDLDYMFLQLMELEGSTQIKAFNKINRYITSLPTPTSQTCQAVADAISYAYVEQGFLQFAPAYGKMFDEAILEQYAGLVRQLPQQMLDNLNIIQKQALKLQISGDITNKQALDLIKSSGDFRGFTFKDRSGRRWKFDTLMNRVIRDQGKNATRFASESIASDLRTDIFQVSVHAGARPKCALDQGKLFSPTGGTFKDINGRTREVLPWSASSEGQPDGLFGYNCRHIKFPMVQGVSVPSNVDPMKRLADELNKDQQVKS